MQGETIALLGVSGSGKTTLLGLLAGIDIPSSGEIYLGGHNMSNITENERAKIRAGNVGFIFQFFKLIQNLTAIENVMLPLELLGEQNAKDKAMELLLQVGLGSRVNHYPKELSGGEQQRVGVARAYVTEPKILFADEPTGNLDQNTGKKIIDMLFSLNDKFNTSLIIATHDNSLTKHCNKTITINDGGLY